MSTSQELKDRFSAGKTPSTEDYGALIDSIPSGGGGTVDSAISSTSQNALQNRVLYDELRVTDTVTREANTVKLSNESSYREIIVLDANNFSIYSGNVIRDGGSDIIGGYIYELPTLDPNKAYKILNSEYVYFSSQNSGTYLLKFCGSSESDSANAVIFAPTGDYPDEDSGYYGPHTFAVEVYPEGGEYNLISFDSSFNYYLDDGGDRSGYGVDHNESPNNWVQNGATESVQPITETVTKTLKQKIQELEARIAALEN